MARTRWIWPPRQASSPIERSISAGELAGQRGERREAARHPAADTVGRREPRQVELEVDVGRAAERQAQPAGRLDVAERQAQLVELASRLGELEMAGQPEAAASRRQRRQPQAERLVEGSRPARASLPLERELAAQARRLRIRPAEPVEAQPRRARAGLRAELELQRAPGLGRDLAEPRGELERLAATMKPPRSV